MLSKIENMLCEVEGVTAVVNKESWAISKSLWRILSEQVIGNSTTKITYSWEWLC